MAKRIRHTGGFIATDDAGRRYTVDKFTTSAIASDNGGSSEIPASVTLKTRDGQHLNRIGKGEYETASGGLKLRSDEPGAP